MNILFTGHKGFLGREMVPYLSQNHNVLCPDIRYTDSRSVDDFIKIILLILFFMQLLEVEEGQK